MTKPSIGERNASCDCPLCREARGEPALKPGDKPKALICFDALYTAAKEEPRGGPELEPAKKPDNVDANGVVQGELE